jgi:hypothetical protein
LGTRRKNERIRGGTRRETLLKIIDFDEGYSGVVVGLARKDGSVGPSGKRGFDTGLSRVGRNNWRRRGRLTTVVIESDEDSVEVVQFENRVLDGGKIEPDGGANPNYLEVGKTIWAENEAGDHDASEPGNIGAGT